MSAPEFIQISDPAFITIHLQIIFAIELDSKWQKTSEETARTLKSILLWSLWNHSFFSL